MAKVLTSKLCATSRKEKADHNKGQKRQFWITAYWQTDRQTDRQTGSPVRTSSRMLWISDFGEL